MVTETINIQVDYTKAKLPFNTPENFNPKRDDKMPTLTTYIHDDFALKEYVPAKRKAVIVVPGGGYHFVSEREGEPVALQFFAAGFQVFVLNYSVAPSVFPASLMELSLAVKYVRDRAEELRIEKDQIAVCGFSAGGHLTASLCNMWQEDFLAESLGVTKEDIRPNGAILSYPVISAGPNAHQGSFKNLLGDEELRFLIDYVSLENRVTENTPKTFLWSTWTDQLVPIMNTLLYGEALAKVGINCEMHIFRCGRHGLSLANEQVVKNGEDGVNAVSPIVNPHVAQWISLACDWVKNNL